MAHTFASICHPSSRCRRAAVILLALALVFPAASGWALDPDEIMVVANADQPESLALAAYYMQKRNLPSGNLVQIQTRAYETISRADYNRQIAQPVHSAVRNKPHIRCLLLFYGLPLRVSAPILSAADKKKLRRLEQEKRNLDALLKSKTIQDAYRQSLETEQRRLETEIGALKKSDQVAAVDSELMLLLNQNHSLAGRIANPFFIGFKDADSAPDKKEVLMVSRLDGPNPKTVRRIIDDTLAAEAAGLTGKAYFDARWPDTDDKPRSGYQFYDQSIHKASRVVKKSGRMPVVIEASEALFQKGDCPEAALYVGWYSLAKYVDAFEWQPGAIGFHIASSECTTLKKAGSRVWCKKMLEDGVAATIGPVGEPYVDGFPLPEVFFGFLVDGYLTLAECYLISLPYLSWKMMLVGDPLYRPFKP